MTEPSISIDHGAGGLASRRLVEDLFVRHFGHEGQALEDSVLLNLPPGQLAFTTDSYVVTPIFFPGGDIGRLAVNGTINDLAMRGARPLYLSAGFILEAGLSIAELDRIVASMAQAASAAGIRIVTGDTKVVPRGAADRIFINTAGIGLVPDGVEISATRGRPGDVVLVSGTIGDHGLAVLSQREGLSFKTEIQSDTASLAHLVQVMLEAGGKDIHALRDPTRGGVASTLNEIAASSRLSIFLDEAALPITPSVVGACDLLGLDPLYVANEGKLLALVAPESAAQVLAAMKAHESGRQAAIIGQAAVGRPGQVFLRTTVGGTRIVDMLTGEQLPRIC